jgi:hypothetical protein
MNREFRLTQRLVASALLLSAVAVAQTGANNSSKSSEHHSKFSKVAFWRHHNDANKDAKHDPSRTAQVKPAVTKESQPSKTQLKTVSAKQPTSKIDQNQHTTKSVTYSAKKPTTKASPASPKKAPKKSMTAQNTPSTK